MCVLYQARVFSTTYRIGFFLLTDANVVYYMICKKYIFMKLSFQPLFLSIVVKYNSFLKYFSRRLVGSW